MRKYTEEENKEYIDGITESLEEDEKWTHAKERFYVENDSKITEWGDRRMLLGKYHEFLQINYIISPRIEEVIDHEGDVQQDKKDLKL
jgi:hypothetical protein